MWSLRSKSGLREANVLMAGLVLRVVERSDPEGMAAVARFDRAGTLVLAGVGDDVGGGWREARVLPEAVAVHFAGCVCCAGGGAWERALSDVFLAHVRGHGGGFSSVLMVLPEGGVADMRRIHADSAMLRARFSLRELRENRVDAGGVS